MLTKLGSIAPLALAILVSSACGPGEPPQSYHSAEQCSTSGITENILDAGLDPAEPLPDSKFPAAWIVAGTGYGSPDRCVAALELLLENGAGVTGLHSGWSVLGRLSVQGESFMGADRVRVVDRLVAAGADPCLSMTDHLDLEHPTYEDHNPQSLADVARMAGSSDATVSALARLEAAC